jgi:hypothetical protein
VVYQGNEVRPPRTPDEVGRKQVAGLAPSRRDRRPSGRRNRLVASALLPCFALLAMGSCAPIVRYTNELVDDRHGRTWFTRLPSTLGGTLGFAAGVPIDVVSLPVTFVVYRSQPKETRDPMSVFLFPSFVLWKVGTLVGAPFDAVEWAAYRSWQDPAPVTPEEREAIERQWDALEFTEYPVTSIYPR